MFLPKFAGRIFHYLKGKNIPGEIDAAVILGSGLGDFVQEIENPRSLPYFDIPGMPQTSVAGHDGKLIFGEINNHSVMAFSGRFHHYEGFTFEETAAPVYLAKAFGTKKMIISNAAGAINTSFSVGDLMVISDLIRTNLSITPRGFSNYKYKCLHPQWTKDVRQLAAGLGFATQEGTYLYTKGPNYETKAEIRAFRRMGADAVGMSTAPELFEAARLELKTAAISLISNMAAGITAGKLSHDEVKAAAASRKKAFATLVRELINKF